MAFHAVALFLSQRAQRGVAVITCSRDGGLDSTYSHSCSPLCPVLGPGMKHHILGE